MKGSLLSKLDIKSKIMLLKYLINIRLLLKHSFCPILSKMVYFKHCAKLRGRLCPIQRIPVYTPQNSHCLHSHSESTKTNQIKPSSLSPWQRKKLPLLPHPWTLYTPFHVCPSHCVHLLKPSAAPSGTHGPPSAKSPKDTISPPNSPLFFFFFCVTICYFQHWPFFIYWCPCQWGVS